MAGAIDQLKGEWKAQTGSTLQVDQAARLDLAGTAPPEADAVLAGSSQLAELAARSWIVFMPQGMLDERGEAGSGTAKAGPRQGGWTEVFTLLRAREAVWGGATVAVPFGSPVLTLYYRADLLEKLGARPPRTWTEYQKLAKLLEDRAKLGELAPPPGSPWSGAMEPLGPGWAGTMLLARAAPYATHRANYSALFQIDTMEPLIDGPPFVRALEEQVAALGSNSGEQLRSDPTTVRRAFWAGRCGMAVTWPSAAEKGRPQTSEVSKTSEVSGTGSMPASHEIRLGLVELPGSMDVYNIAPQAWESRRPEEDPHVPLLGIAGRLGTVTTCCASPETAFRLLFWLSSQQWNRQVSAISPATTLFRQSDMRFPQAWTEAEIPPATAAQYALLTQQTLSRQQWTFALRIPGRGEYLAVLDDAVQQAIRGQQKPQEALRQAKTRWRDITSRLGLDRQRDAYRRSLGL
jgi:ABC-type glycerol-3-phosphate transport system substrate-binding protein